MKLARSFFLPILLGAMGAQAFLPYPERQLKYPRIPSWDSKIPVIWEGWKARMVVGGLVQANDPSQNKKPVSEGQSYGMLLSVWMGDRATFNSIWAATEKDFWKGQWYSWDRNDPNYAGDADIDICGALIFASALVDAKHWDDYTVSGNNYKAKAKILLASIMTNFIDKNNNYRINSWPTAGDGIRNPSYHMPQWYPIFSEFAKANGMQAFDWDAATKGAYDFLEAQPKAEYGIARNFSNGTGGAPSGGTSTPGAEHMGFDAIRVPYRIGMAAIWYKQPRALTYGEKVWKSNFVAAKKAGMYKINNNVPELWGWDDAQYEKFMPRTMWGTLAQGTRSVSAAATAKADSLISQVVMSLTGYSFISGEDSDTTKSTSANKNYYAQSLGLLGVLAMSGRAWNVWDDLKNNWVVPDTSAQIVSALAASPASIALTKAGGTAITTSIKATLSHDVRWTLRLTGSTSGARYDFTATSSTVALDWNSTVRTLGTTKAFTTETVDVRLIYPGGDTTKAGQRATITLTPPSAVGIRPIKGDGVRRVANGWLLQDAALREGIWTRAVVRDFQGRTVRAVELDNAHVDEAGLVIPMPRFTMPTILLIESGSGLAPRSYVLGPSL